MDKISNDYTGFKELLRGPFAPTVIEDNHGNVRHGEQITCANGELVDLSLGDLRRDNRTIHAASGNMVGSVSEHELGNEL